MAQNSFHGTGTGGLTPAARRPVIPISLQWKHQVGSQHRRRYFPAGPDNMSLSSHSPARSRLRSTPPPQVIGRLHSPALTAKRAVPASRLKNDPSYWTYLHNIRFRHGHSACIATAVIVAAPGAQASAAVWEQLGSLADTLAFCLALSFTTPAIFSSRTHRRR